MSIYESFIRRFNIDIQDILWAVNRPSSQNEFNLANVTFDLIVPVFVNDQELITLYNPQWEEL